MVPPDADEWDFPNRATPLGSPAYYAVRFSPEHQRQCNARLLAWRALIDEIIDRPRDPGVARIKLDWWRNEVGTLGAGEPRHPLLRTLRANGLGSDAVAPMQRLVDAAEQSLLAGGPQDDTAFAAACRARDGAFFALLASADNRHDHDPQACMDAGGYCAAVERIRRVGLRPEQLPPDARHDTHDRARRSARFEALLAQFAAPATLREARLPETARRLTALASALHRKLRRRGYPVFDTLVDRPPIGHLWTAWRCR